jgi:hypothetical protein
MNHTLLHIIYRCVPILFFHPDELYFPIPYNTHYHLTHPVYITTYSESNNYYINYAMYYAYNDGKILNIGHHADDLEHITIELDRDYFPNRIYYGRHTSREGQWYLMDGIHQPRVYIALGSHGNYAEAGDYQYERYYGFGDDYTSDRGKVIDPTPVILDNISISSYFRQKQWLYSNRENSEGLDTLGWNILQFIQSIGSLLIFSSAIHYWIKIFRIILK